MFAVDLQGGGGRPSLGGVHRAEGASAPRQFHAGHAKGWGRSGQREALPCCILPTMPAPLGDPALLRFDDALRQAQSNKRWQGGIHLLVGNGFSIGAHEGFRYESLYAESKEALSDNSIAVFENYGTTNFEQVLHKLHEADWIASTYGLYSEDGVHLIKNDHDDIKSALLSAVEVIHPVQANLEYGALESAEEFLRNFKSVFSICYDLLLYWSMNIYAPDEYHFQDGFDGMGESIFTGRTRQDKVFVYFLHGALHLIREKGVVRKLVRTEDSSILEQVREHMSKGTYPLIVTEGNPIEKRIAIEASSYLSWAFRRFQNVRGTLFTYGTSLSDPDDHIREAIIQNFRLRSLYVGIHPKESQSKRYALMSVAERLKEHRAELPHSKSLSVEFYNSATAPAWGAP